MTITFDEVERELRTIIATDGPDHVYERPVSVRSSGGTWIQNESSCYYAHVDQETGAVTEGCIVGAWLARFHRVDLTGLVGELGDARELIKDGTVLRNEEVDPDAVILLRQVQIHQDLYEPWGEALECALIDFREGNYETDDEDQDEDYDDSDLDTGD